MQPLYGGLVGLVWLLFLIDIETSGQLFNAARLGPCLFCAFFLQLCVLSRF